MAWHGVAQTDCFCSLALHASSHVCYRHPNTQTQAPAKQQLLLLLLAEVGTLSSSPDEVKCVILLSGVALNPV